VRREAVFKGLVAKTEWSAQIQHLYSEVVYIPQMRSLPVPPIVDFISQINNNVTAHYLKCLDCLIFVPTAIAVYPLWTTLHSRKTATAAEAVFIYTHKV